MAIINLNKSSLTDSKIGNNLPLQNNTTITEGIAPKSNFLASTIEELKKVKWPNAKYVASWSIMVICFTAVFSMILGTSDHVFETGINFVDCSSTKGKSRPLDTCLTEAGRKLFGVEVK